MNDIMTVTYYTGRTEIINRNNCSEDMWQRCIDSYEKHIKTGAVTKIEFATQEEK
jgi:hypothetical protein